MRSPVSFVDTFSNDELLVIIRRGACDVPGLAECLALTIPEFEARHERGLFVLVSPDEAESSSYVLTVTNSGSRTYTNLRIRYEPVLLNADSFGLDTTYMRHGEDRKSGASIEIPVLAPGDCAQVTRVGYASHDRYDRHRQRVIDIEFMLDGNEFSAKDRRWCIASIDLPNAKQD
jgi:hypothetical protein